MLPLKPPVDPVQVKLVMSAIATPLVVAIIKFTPNAILRVNALDALNEPVVKSFPFKSNAEAKVVPKVVVPVTVSAPLKVVVPPVFIFSDDIVLLLPTIVPLAIITANRLVYVPPASVNDCKFNVVVLPVVAPATVLVLPVKSSFLK